MVIADKAIIFKLRRGDKKTYEQLFLDNYKNLVLYAKKFVMETETARDLVQDVFIYLWDKREKLNIDKSLSSYLFRAVHNACINYLKREATKENYIKQFLINLNEGAYKTSASEDAYELVVHKDLSERIEWIIETLPEQCRNIFRMSRFRGMKNKEIAEIYSISPRTVETQIYRALKVLKENLKPYLSLVADLS
jgi:RNA polymerase sigma-70 factor (ECF subfamily)